MFYTVIGIGETGMGKSTFLNAYLQKNAFQASDSPDSCTKITSVDSNIINNQTRKAIDTPGIKDTDNTDQENVRQLAEFLINYKDGINVVALVLNGQNDRFNRDTEKFIKITHQMFNHVDFFDHLCIIFTKWYNVMTPEQKRIKQEEYKKRIIESIERYTEQKINLELPMFFVDSPNYQNEQNTKTELERFNTFVTSKNALKTTQVKVPDVIYEKVIPEKKNNVRYKENLICENGMKRIEYFADQSRNKLIDYYGNVSYSDWKNDKEWEIVKYKKIEVENIVGECIKTVTTPIYERRQRKRRVLGVCVGFESWNEYVGSRETKTFIDKKRNKITDFDGNISYENWEIIKTYTR